MLTTVDTLTRHSYSVELSRIEIHEAVLSAMKDKIAKELGSIDDLKLERWELITTDPSPTASLTMYKDESKWDATMKENQERVFKQVFEDLESKR